jgi:hypothetical protein
MIDIFINYEWLVNLCCMIVFTLGMFIEEKIVVRSFIISLLILISYLTLLFSVVLNGLIKGF